MRKVEKVSEWIVNHGTEIVESIKQESIDKYLKIQSYFDSGFVGENHDFRRLFSDFYRLNAVRPTQDFKNSYFKKFDLLKGTELTERVFKNTLNEWYLIPSSRGYHRVEFSFLSKLLHTLDINQPIYDKFVRILWDMECEVRWSPVEKIDNYYIQYQQLSDVVKIIVDQDLLADTVNILDRNKKNTHQLSMVKKIDFLFWQGGNLLSQQGGLK